MENVNTFIVALEALEEKYTHTVVFQLKGVLNIYRSDQDKKDNLTTFIKRSEYLIEKYLIKLIREDCCENDDLIDDLNSLYDFIQKNIYHQ